MPPRIRALPLCVVLILAGTHVWAATSEDGGSGLVNVDQAWSLPLSGVVISTYGGTFSSDATTGSSRRFSFTPSATKGLGGGFEASAALPFQGLSLDLEGEDFDRSFEVRRDDIVGKVRWSGPLSTPRVRVGVQGLLTLPIDDVHGQRAGGTKRPSSAFDPGIVGLLSTNVGWFSFPVRINVNAGYWWSRDDGATYYRTLPVALPLAADSIASNDVTFFGVAAEAGFRRFQLFAELFTEQLMGARAQLRASENLWRLTPGVRTEISQSIALTVAMSFNLSTDDASTTFDPGGVYPDTHFRVGLTLGHVLTRLRYESRARARSADWTRTRDDGHTAPPQPATEAVVAAPEATASTVDTAVPAGRAVTEQEASAAVLARAAAEERARMSTLESRLDRVEAELRLRDLEARIASLEASAPPRAARLPDAAAPPASAPLPVQPPTSAPSSGADVSDTQPASAVAGTPTPFPPRSEVPALLERLASMEREIAQLRAPDTTSAAPAVTPTTGVARTLPVETATPAPSGASPRQTSEPPVPVAAPPAVSTPVAQAPVTQAPVAQAPVAQAPAAQTRTPQAASTSPSFPPVTVVTGGRRDADPSVTWVTGAPVVTPAPASPGQADQAMPLSSAWAELDSLASVIERGVVGNAGTRAAAPPTVAPTPQETPAPTPDFPLGVGERQSIPFDPTSVNPVAQDSVRVALDAWAELLLTYPDVRVGIFAYDDSEDRGTALQETEKRAAAVRDYLVVAGVEPLRIVAMGMGVAGMSEGTPTGTRLVIERLE